MISNVTQDMWTTKRIQYVLIFALVSGLLTAGWFGYAWYIDRYEQAAYKDLAESIDGYYKALSSTDAGRWADVERAFQAGSERHKSSKLYPYFLAYKADALSYQGKQKEAQEVMNVLLTSMNTKHPLYYFYTTKAALMKLDASEEAVKKEGRDQMQKLAQDNKNPARDMALYYRGLDAWQQGNKEDAQKLWNDIIAQGNKDSQWYQRAQAKIRSEA